MTLPASFDLTGRVALVTGAGGAGGIGLASARLLCELGARVVVTSTTDRVQERAAELGTAYARGVVADLTQDGAAERTVQEAVDAWGRLDIVINNAGMTSQALPGEAESGDIGMSLERWRASMARNLESAFLVCRAAAPQLAEWGRIVNVASVTGPLMAMRGEVAYAAAKAGMVGLTRAMALDLAARGVTVNAVLPGWIATDSQTDDEARQGNATPMGRSATAAEVASAVVWLCTPGASYVTGQCVVVDGGNSIAEQRG